MNPRLLLAPLAALLIGAVAWIVLHEPQAPASSGDAAVAETQDLRGPRAAAPGDLSNASSPRTDEPEPSAVARTAERSVASMADAEPAEDDEPDERRRYRGRVLNSDGRVVPDAEIELQPNIDNPLALFQAVAKASAESDAFGNYEILGLGKVVVRAEADGYEPYRAEWSLPLSTAEPLEDIVLEPGVVLHGQVVAEGGGALPGAELFLTDPDRGFFGGMEVEEGTPDAVADNGGYFELARVERGEWAVVAQIEGRPLRVFEGASGEPGRISPGLRLELPAGGSIAGRVDNLGSRDPSEYRVRAVVSGRGAGRFSVGGQSFEVLNEEGRFEFTGLDRDLEYTVSLVPNGMSFVRASGMTGVRSEEVDAVPGGAEVALAYLEGKRIELQLVDDASGKPVTAARVAFGQLMNMNEPESADGGKTQFHPEGRVVFRDVHTSEMEMMTDGMFRLEIQAEGYIDVVLDEIELEDDEDVVDLGQVRLERAPVLRVTVLDSESGDPIKRANVRLDSNVTYDPEADEDDDGDWTERFNNRTRKAKTNSEGLATIASFGQKPARLQVTRTGYAVAVIEDVVVPAAGDELTVKLAEEASLVVRVVDPSGSPVRDLDVIHRRPSGENEREEVDRRGKLKLRRLEAGTHALRVSEPGSWWSDDDVDADWTEVLLGPGGEVELELLAPARFAVRGRVTSGGEPVADAFVSLHVAEEEGEPLEGQIAELKLRQSGSEDTTNADGKGEFEFQLVEQGRYLLRAERPESDLGSVVELEVRSGPARQDIAIGGGRVRGRVLDERGKPVVNARVRLRAASPEDTEWTPRGGKWMDDGRGRMRGPAVVNLGGSLGEPNMTDSDGRFELADVPLGQSLAAFATHDQILEARSEVFTLEDGGTQELEVECLLAGSIGVSIESSQPGTMNVSRLLAWPLGDEERRIEGWLWGDSSGNFTGLEAGTWEVAIVESDGWSIVNRDDPNILAKARVEVRAGEGAEVVLEAP